jgi:hypothetical protein
MEMPTDLRPDKCKVVFSATTKPYIINAALMPGSPHAWQKGNVKAVIDKLVDIGFAIVIGLPGTNVKTLINREGIREIRMTDPDEDGIQWNID